jgi:hypothetical protein
MKNNNIEKRRRIIVVTDVTMGCKAMSLVLSPGGAREGREPFTAGITTNIVIKRANEADTDATRR